MGVTTIITGIAVVLLVLHWRGPNAVWGGATMGIIAGVIVALVTKDWVRLLSFFAVGIFIGTFFEWMGRITSKWYHKQG